MKCGARVALGVAGGYFLGRTKKMKLAMMLGGMAAGRRAGGPAELLAQGNKLLGQSPELAKLTDEVRGRLVEAGKGAALAVAARQVESLTDLVGKRVESLSAPGPRRTSGRQQPAAEEPEPEDTPDEPESEELQAPAPAQDDGEAGPEKKSVRQRAGGTATAVKSRTGKAGAGGKRPAGRSSAAAGTGGRATRTRRGGDDG